LLGGKETVHGFQTLGVLADAFDLVDSRFVGQLRAKVKSIQGVFSTMREIRLSDDGLHTWLDTFRTLKQWEAWQAHGQWIRAVHPHFAPNIEGSFESASRLTEADRDRALAERDRLIGTLRRHLDGVTVLCLPSAWTIAPLKKASAEELAANRVKDLTLGSVASLSGAPQVSIPVVTESYAIGLGLLAAPGNDARLLALTELLAS
jgi:amidase